MAPWELREKLFLRVGQRLNYAGKLHDLDVLGAVVPIVAPADNDVAAIHWMPVVAEIPAFKFKFDVHALPSFGTNLLLGLAIREPLLHGFDPVAKISRQHSKEEHDALFIHRFMREPDQVERIAVRGPVFERRAPCFVRRYWA